MQSILDACLYNLLFWPFQTAIAMATFYLAMTLYPAVLKRAQEEIDRVIGDERLPSFADYGSLPYVTAILKEVLRWEVILPAGIIRCYFACIKGHIRNSACRHSSLHDGRG